MHDNRDDAVVLTVAMTGVSAGAWTFFLLVFKLAFPSTSSGRRRAIGPLRALALRVMPAHVSR